uniref:Small ribosomal subunit protein mS33 n=1 Tax=Ciona savignyi TaxID=51511 RepID=H2Y4S8_CIOSA
MSRNPSKYAHSMARLSARIFAEPVPESARRGQHIHKYLTELPYYKDRSFTHYYPPVSNVTLLLRNLRHLGLYVDEHQDFKEEMNRQRNLRGKGKSMKQSL